MSSLSSAAFLTDDLKMEIQTLICDIIEVEMSDLTESTLFRDELQLDSLTVVEVIAALEKRFGVTIEEEQAKRMVNLAAVYEVLQESSPA